MKDNANHTPHACSSIREALMHEVAAWIDLEGAETASSDDYISRRYVESLSSHLSHLAARSRSGKLSAAADALGRIVKLFDERFDVRGARGGEAVLNNGQILVRFGERRAGRLRFFYDWKRGGLCHVTDEGEERFLFPVENPVDAFSRLFVWARQDLQKRGCRIRPVEEVGR